MNWKWLNWKTGAALLVAAAAFAAVELIASDDDGDRSSEQQAKATDGAFMAAMVPHHETAVEMAEIAQERGQHPEIRELADAIIAAQTAEIEQMQGHHERMFGESLSAMGGDHGDLGLSAEEAGMHMGPAEMAALEKAKLFDQAFIDQMIPHHQGAIRMAQIELEQGEDDEVQALADGIIEAQTAEIEEMNAWRLEWFGAASPAGGASEAEGGATPSHEEMGH